MFVPPIRRLKEQKDAALKQIVELSRRLDDLETVSTKARLDPPVGLDALVNRSSELSRRLDDLEAVSTKAPLDHPVDMDALVSHSVEKSVSIIRKEFTPLPRFSYHLPLDYEQKTLPPQFDPPVWIPGEILPLPPPDERHGHEDSKYLEWGRYDHGLLLDHIRRELPSIDNLAVMDFGCSSGRVLRHFLPEIREYGWKLTGVDVSARRIEWLRRNFPPEFQVYTGSVLPMLPFESNSFDVIYGLSVFTHMKFLWDTWLLEMRRVLKPGGLLIQTIHTENAWNFFVQHGKEDWARNSLGSMIIDQKKLLHDFVYFGDISSNQVFWKKEIALDFWGRYFPDVTILPPPREYWYQDWVVARKPKVGATLDRAALEQRIAEMNSARASAAQATVSSDEVTGSDLEPKKETGKFSVDRDFSQQGEQPIILDFFSRLRQDFNPYCVDAGAYDGFVGSNSRALFLNGWPGVVIEPNPRVFARLQELYEDNPSVKCVQKALSDTPRESVPMKFSLGPAGTEEEDKWKYAQVSTLHDNLAASYETGHGYLYETSLVFVDTLTNVLHAVGAPKDIGFMSIDCEGEDLNILRQLDLETFHPLLICVEADDQNRHLFVEVIEPRGYIMHAQTPSNTFFRSKTSLLTGYDSTES
jgi:FkbM family methyltransferase